MPTSPTAPVETARYARWLSHEGSIRTPARLGVGRGDLRTQRRGRLVQALRRLPGLWRRQSQVSGQRRVMSRCEEGASQCIDVALLRQPDPRLEEGVARAAQRRQGADAQEGREGHQDQRLLAEVARDRNCGGAATSIGRGDALTAAASDAASRRAVIRRLRDGRCRAKAAVSSCRIGGVLLRGGGWAAGGRRELRSGRLELSDSAYHG